MRSPPITAARDPRRERNSTLAQALLWAAGGTGFTALLTVLMVGSLQPLMPWLLSFAAGAMLYVVVEELIPGAHLEDHSSRGGTLGVMAGFLLMMILDVALG